MKTIECKVCGGQGKPSKSLLNELVAAQDFGGETIHTRGATLSRLGKANLVDCLKCEDCGHSWIPEKSTREQALEWWNKLPDFGIKDVLKTGKHGLAFNYYPKRTFQSLTGREIEEIWRKETSFMKTGLTQSEWIESCEQYFGGKPNQKQFKQFDAELFMKYISKFSLEDRYNATAALLLTLNFSVDELAEINNKLIQNRNKNKES